MKVCVAGIGRRREAGLPRVGIGGITIGHKNSWNSAQKNLICAVTLHKGENSFIGFLRSLPEKAVGLPFEHF